MSEPAALDFLKPLPPEQPYPRARAGWIGLLFGGLAGLVYTLCSQLANQSLLPGIPLAHHPFGFWGNLLASAGAGMLIGLLCALPRRAPLGVGLGLTALIAAFLGASLLSGAYRLAQAANPFLALLTLMGLGFSFLLLLPLMAGLRWGLARLLEGERRALLRGGLTLLALGGLTGMAGWLDSYPPETLTAVRAVQALVMESRGAGIPGAHPTLRTPQVLAGLTARRDLTYAFTPVYAADRREALRYAAGLGGGTAALEFADGWRLECVVDETLGAMACFAGGGR